MITVEYQGTFWEINDEVSQELISEGIVKSEANVAPAHKAGNYALTDEFCDNWGHKTHEAFCMAVAVFQAHQALEENDLPNLADNLTDAVVTLKGGRV
jgi:hypothetical protein